MIVEQRTFCTVFFPLVDRGFFPLKMDLLTGDGRDKKFLSWLEERGILREMRLFFRKQVSLLLHDPQSVVNRLETSWPAATRAVNWLIAEHMLQRGCCFSLSVFKSEAPLLEEIPCVEKQELVVSPLVLEKILGEVGFRRGEQAFLALQADYRASRGSLLECVLIQSRKAFEAWGKRQHSDYATETMRKLSAVDAFVDRVRVEREFLTNDSPVLQDALKKKLRTDLEKFREQERAVIREQERAKVEEEIYWKHRQIELDLGQRTTALNDREKKLRDEMKAFENQCESHETAITEAVRELEISERSLKKKLREVEVQPFVQDLKNRLAAKVKTFDGRQAEAEELVAQIQEEYRRVQVDDRDRAQLLDELESLKTLMNTLYDAVASLEEENKRLKDAARKPMKLDETVSDQGPSGMDSSKVGVDDLKRILETTLASRDGDLRKDMRTVQDGLAKLAETTASQKSEIRSATALVTKLERKLSDAQSQLDGLRSEYYEATAKRRLLEKKMDLTKAVESRLLRIGTEDVGPPPASLFTKKLQFLQTSSSEDSKSSTEDFLKESQRRMKEIEGEVRELDFDLVSYRRRLAVGPAGKSNLFSQLGRSLEVSRPRPREVRFLEDDDFGRLTSRQAWEAPVEALEASRTIVADAARRDSVREHQGNQPAVEQQQVAPEEETSRMESSRKPSDSAPVREAMKNDEQEEASGRPKFSLFAVNLDQAWNK